MRQTVDELIIRVITDALDCLVDACVDERGQPKAPSKEAVIAARKILPARCKHTLVKKSPMMENPLAEGERGME